jgi:hypothetical protein
LVGLLEQVQDFLNGDLTQAFAGFPQFLIESDRGILHPLVRLSRSADQQEVFAFCNPMMAVGVVQSDPNKADDLALFLLLFSRHLDTPILEWFFNGTDYTLPHRGRSIAKKLALVLS